MSSSSFFSTQWIRKSVCRFLFFFLMEWCRIWWHYNWSNLEGKRIPTPFTKQVLNLIAYFCHYSLGIFLEKSVSLIRKWFHDSYFPHIFRSIQQSWRTMLLVMCYTQNHFLHHGIHNHMAKNLSIIYRNLTINLL